MARTVTLPALRLTAVPARHPALIAPRQRRGRAMAERVLVATVRLLRRADFAAIAMADIAREAGVSVGSIYSRFPSKERLLCFLADRMLLAEPGGAAVRVLKPLERAPDLRTFLDGYIAGIADVFTRHRAIIAPMSSLARVSRDSELKVYLRRVNAAAHRRLRAALLKYAGEITHPSPRTAIDVSILWLGAALRERILFEEPVSRLHRTGAGRFVAELAAALTAYLTAPRRRGR